MPKATLLRPRSLNTNGLTFVKNVETPVSMSQAKTLESDPRFKIVYENGEDTDDAEAEVDDQGRPSKKGDRIVAISQAISKLSKDDYTNAGVPDARALTRDLGWQVTAAERDAAFSEYKKGPDGIEGTDDDNTPLARHSNGEEVSEPDAAGTGNNTTLKGTVQSERIEGSRILPEEKSDLGNNAPQNKLANDTGPADNGNLGLEPNLQQPETNADGTDKTIANADGSPKGPSKLDPKEKGDMSPRALGGNASDLHKGARASQVVDTANGPDDQLGVVNATGAPLQAAEQAGTTDVETEPSRKVGLKLTKHRNPVTGELTDQAVQSRGPKEGVDDVDPSTSGAKEI